MCPCVPRVQSKVADNSLGHTAYDQENPFIPPLIEFTRKIGTQAEYQHIKLVGVCFGHQIISIAMGGECKAGEEGWEIGVYGNEVTEEGKRWWGDVSGEGRDDKVVSEVYSP